MNRTLLLALLLDSSEGTGMMRDLIADLRQRIVDAIDLCWDVLILLAIVRTGDVWLSTYAEADLGHLGAVRTIDLDGRRGGVLSAEQFDAMVGG